MPYLTPEDIPEERECRALLIPANTDWLAIVSGALTELVKSYNWEQGGAVTVAEATAAMQVMIDTYYEGCVGGGCVLPEGQAPIRVGVNGHVEQLIDDVWTDPTGDYTIPPIPEREGGTEEDQICLAAKNAVNVLEELYEQVTDSFDAELTVDEAISALVIFIGTLPFMVAFAPIAASILIFLAPIFAAFYSLMEYLTSDLWTAEFSRNLICILNDCANNDDGVVTFDWECFNNALEAQVDDYGLSETQLRLFVQIGYLLSVIGGVDALNAAGSSTELTDDDCEFCGEEKFCIEIISPIEGLDPIVDCTGNPNTWNQGFQVVLNDAGTSGIFQIDHLEMDVQYTGAGTPPGEAYFVRSDTNCGFTDYETAGVAAAGVQHFTYDPPDWDSGVNRVSFYASCSNNESNSMGNVLQIKRIKIVGHALAAMPEYIDNFVDYNCL